jgi:hypothetical protein
VSFSEEDAEENIADVSIGDTLAVIGMPSFCNSPEGTDHSVHSSSVVEGTSESDDSHDGTDHPVHSSRPGRRLSNPDKLLTTEKYAE